MPPCVWVREAKGPATPLNDASMLLRASPTSFSHAVWLTRRHQGFVRGFARGFALAMLDKLANSNAASTATAGSEGCLHMAWFTDFWSPRLKREPVHFMS